MKTNYALITVVELEKAKVVRLPEATLSLRTARGIPCAMLAFVTISAIALVAAAGSSLFNTAAAVASLFNA